MKHNYHIHTHRCGHAYGTETEYIEKAISEGLLTLGFSDHTPYPYPGGYVSPDKMRMDQMEEYFDTLLSLRHRYRDYIDIKIGFEVEYYPAFFDELLREYRKYPLDYIIYGGHFIGNESLPDSFCSFFRTEDNDKLKRYVDHTVEALKTGRFTYVAHPDLIQYVGADGYYRQQMRRLITVANELSLPLEINLYGIRDNRFYPHLPFWEEAAALGATAVFGCDAHRPELVAVPGEIEMAKRLADRVGINVIDEVKLIDPLK